MTELPAPLRPWSAELQTLPLELAVALGPMVRRLAAALGPLRSQPEPGGTDPDGLSGLTRRGPWDRLLHSEWVLAEAVPDEFIRRAAMRELLFLEIQRRTPQRGRRCVALLDAGPDQLGAPRIAHIALLCVLARRAANARAELHWGVLQQRGSLYRGVGRAQIRKLLPARCLDDPTEEDLERGLARMGEVPQTVDELWLLGGPRAAALPCGAAGRLVVEEPLLEEGLRVSMSRPGGVRRSISLPLPKPHVCTALLRRPFDAPPAVRTSKRSSLRAYGPLVGDLRFSAEGGRLITQTISGAVVAYRVPDRVGGRLRRPAVLELGSSERALAVGWSRQKLCVVVGRSDKRLEARGIHGEPRTAWPTQLLAGERPRVAVHAVERDRPVLWFLGPQGSLWGWEYEHSERLVRSALEGTCLALGRRDGRPLTVIQGPEGLTCTLGATADGSGEAMHVPCADLVADAAFIGPARHAHGSIAVRVAPDRWQVVAGTHKTALQVLPGERVWGLSQLGQRRHPVLLLDRPDGKLVVRGSGHPHVLPTDGRVVCACASPGGARVAWLTAEGGAVVWDLDQQAAVLTLEPFEGAS